MKNKIFSVIISIMSVILISCGGEGTESSDAGDFNFERIEDTGKIYTFDDFKSIGYKKGRQAKSDKLLPGMTEAYWGFWKVPQADWSGKDMIDYELRFYASHSDAVSMGEVPADSRSGANDGPSPGKVRSKPPDEAVWKELLKEARECQGEGGHHTGACIVPKYGDFKIFNNVVILAQGTNAEEAQKHINLIIIGLAPASSTSE